MSKLKLNANITDTGWMWGVKGIAVMGILLYHWFSFFPTDVLGGLIKYGAQGAHTFFTMSAFGLYLSLLKGKRGIDGPWVLKRFLKVLVPYYMAIVIICITVLIYALLIGNFSEASQQFDLNLRSVLASILLYRGFVDRYVFIINPAWWFVITILELYLVFPFLCFLYRSTSRTVFLGVILFINLFYQYWYAVFLGSNSPVLAKLFPAFLFEFGIGIWLADLYLNNPEIFFKFTLGLKPFIVGILLRCFSMLLTQQGKEGYAFTNVFTAAGFTLIAFNIYFFLSQNNHLKMACEWLGRQAFSIFLLHESYIVIIFNLLKGTHLTNAMLWFVLSGYVCFILVLAFLFQKYFINGNILIHKYFVPAH